MFNSSQQRSSLTLIEHIFQCLCSKEEVAVDSTLHKGQHVSWIRHASKTQIVNGIVVHSGASVKDDFDSSEVRIILLYSIKQILNMKLRFSQSKSKYRFLFHLEFL